MRRTVVVVATFLGVLFSGRNADALVPLGTPNVDKPAPCSAIRWKLSAEHRVRLIRCLFANVPGGADRALEVALCESGPDLDPRALYEGNAGLFQHRLTYWRGRAHRYLTPRYDLDPATVSPYNAYANAVVTARMVREQGWSAWSCA